MMRKTAVAIRHVGFEDLGIFEPVLKSHGYDIAYLEAGVDDLTPFFESDLGFALGGPIGVYEKKIFPFIAAEQEFIKKRMESGRPTMGICLGAQFMAAALGGRVYSSGKKEIGWFPLHVNDAGKKSFLSTLDGEKVLHWHGDTYDLPGGVSNLIRSDMIEQQAFIYKKSVALQFHIEADLTKIEKWLIGHTAELATAKIDILKLREDSRHFGPELAKKGQTLLHAWLQSVGMA
jgi:GMP synthase (glutamine-hydrolysing)